MEPYSQRLDDYFLALAASGKGVIGGALLLVVALALLNGAFSLAEAALLALRPSRVDQLVEEGRRGAAAVKRLSADPARYLATAQVGITLVGFAAAAAAALTLAAPLAAPLRALGLGSLAAVVAVALVTLISAVVAMVLGGLAPKALALQAPDTWALRLAPFLHLCSYLFFPLTALALALSKVLVRPFGATARYEVPMMTREEFEQAIDSGGRHGEIDDDEAKIIGNIFDLSETPVRAVMTPRIDITGLSVDAPLDQIVAAVLQSGHSRLPVFEGSVDNVLGIVHAKDLLPGLAEGVRTVDLRLVMRNPYFVPETRRVSDLLTEMRRSRQQIAIVQDEYAGTAGLVTIEDLLEEIVGDIRDEYDIDEPDVQVLSVSESLIDGRMNIGDLSERLGIDLSSKEYDTIGGLIFGILGHEPVVGDRVTEGGIEFVVEKIEGRRIKLLRALRARDAEDRESPEEAVRPQTG